jgi:hypothetical protein
MLPTSAGAHSFGRLYNLPVPFWLYGFGAAAALVLSFLIVGVSVATSRSAAPEGARDIGQMRWVRALRRVRFVPALQALSVFGLLLCILTGFFGTSESYRNFNMTFFWVVFVLGFAYLTAIAGDLYAVINPWRVIAQALARVFPGFTRGRLHYPQALAYWPALVFYMVFIWIELFGQTRPFSLAAYLLAYTGINLAGVLMLGSTVWFRYCEFWSVFLRLLGRMSPLEYRPAEPDGAASRLRWRAPFSGLLQERAESLSLVVFGLFMLSSTAFDGLHSTLLWLQSTLRWFQQLWNSAELLTAWLGREPSQLAPILQPLYLAYQTLFLLASPFLYLAIYLFFVWLARRVTRSARPVRELALDFAYPLLPIALVYNITHYFTLILTQGVSTVSLLSDPFGWGWNLFSTLGLPSAPILPDMSLVWHTQVALILFGHIVGVYLAHVVALRVFATRRDAVRSQLPMLCLMVLFTIAGLWILAQPMQSGAG